MSTERINARKGLALDVSSELPLPKENRERKGEKKKQLFKTVLKTWREKGGSGMGERGGGVGARRCFGSHERLRRCKAEGLQWVGEALWTSR